MKSKKKWKLILIVLRRACFMHYAYILQVMNILFCGERKHCTHDSYEEIVSSIYNKPHFTSTLVVTSSPRLHNLDSAITRVGVDPHENRYRSGCLQSEYRTSAALFHVMSLANEV